MSNVIGFKKQTKWDWKIDVEDYKKARKHQEVLFQYEQGIRNVLYSKPSYSKLQRSTNHSYKIMGIGERSEMLDEEKIMFEVALWSEDLQDCVKYYITSREVDEALVRMSE